MKNLIILVVEDDNLSRFILTTFFEKSSATVHEAAHGKEAIEMLRLYPEINIITLDLNMPIMDGYDFLKDVQNSGIAKGAKIFITSAAPRYEFEQVCNSMGINGNVIVDYFEKPYDIANIVDTITAA
ncbi:MAG: response regulator [Taibaiella sp.]|nr:response regulator [Taibaiella sp.]